MRGWLSLHISPPNYITKHTGYLLHIVFRLIINLVDLWETMSSYFIQDSTRFLLGLYRVFRIPYYVVRLINTPSKTKLLCLRYIFWKVVSVYMEQLTKKILHSSIPNPMKSHIHYFYLLCFIVLFAIAVAVELSV